MVFQFPVKAAKEVKIGQIIYFCGYGDFKCVVIEINNYNAKCIKLNSFKYTNIDLKWSEHISNKKDNRIASYITDKILSEKDVKSPWHIFGESKYIFVYQNKTEK